MTYSLPNTNPPDRFLRSELCEKITDLFAREMNLEIPSVEADLFEMGLIDSLAFVDLVTRLEREFGLQVTIEDLEIDNFRSVERIAAFLASKTE